MMSARASRRLSAEGCGSPEIGTNVTFSADESATSDGEFLSR